MSNYSLTLLCFLFYLSAMCQDITDSQWVKIDSLVDCANQQVQSGQYSRANKTCDQLLKLYDGPGAHLLKAQAVMEGRRVFSSDMNIYKVSTYHLDRAIEKDSTYYQAFGRKGLLNIIYQDFETAIFNYTEFLKFATDSSEIFNGLTDRGTAKSYLGNIDGAISDYYQAMQFDSTHFSIFQNLSAMLIDAGRYDEANEMLEKGIALYPSDQGMLNNLGYLKLKEEKYQDAITYFDKAIKLDPNNYLAIGNRGYCKLKLSDISGGEIDMIASKSINPENAYIYKYLGLLYIEKKARDKACLQFSKALDLGYTKVYGNDVEELKRDHCK